MAAVTGRERELAICSGFLDAASERFAVLVLAGEAGVGKTTVWRETTRIAESRGFRVLTCRPAQAEATFSLSAVADLLDRVPDAVEALPEPQRRALEVALFRAEPGETPLDQRAVATAVRELFTGLASERPVVVAIDDVQWLDTASAAILQFVLRRLVTERVALVVARRLAEPAHLRIDDLVPPERLTRITIGPLSLGALHQLLKQRLERPLPRSALIRVHKTSAGNPLFALEIGRLLTERGIPAVGEPLPVPADIGAVVLERVGQLPAATREVLLVAAMLAEPRTDLVSAALGRAIEDDLGPAERDEIATCEGDRIRFAHPLFAEAIVSTAPASERRGTHRRLADVVEGLEERVRHRALAAERPDEATAAVVHAAARDAIFRGAPRAAAELLELALRLGEPGAAREALRLLELAECLHAVGETDRTLELLEGSAWVHWPPELCARAVALLGDVLSYTAPPAAAIETLDAMLRQPLPAQARAAVHTLLSYHRSMDFDPSRAAQEAEAALALLEPLGEDADPGIHARALSMRLRSRVFLGQGLDRTIVDRVLRLEARLPPGRRQLDRPSAGFGFWFKHVDDLDASRSWLTRELEALGDEPRQRDALEHLAVTECWAGNLELARAHARSALELSEPGSVSELRATSALALVEAHLGSVDDVRALSRCLPSMWSLPQVEIRFGAALGLVYLSLGDQAAADDHLRTCLAAAEQLGWREPGVLRIHADAAEAAVAVGDLERAAEIAGFLERHGERTGHRWSRATGARVSALLLAARGDLEHALATVERALEVHEGLPMPLELGRTLLVKGRIERRTRLRSRAKQSFEQAAEIFDRIGARLWAERARDELERVGLRRATAGELTTNERRVAELAARGLTNREVAAALFLSPKTVEANLARAYRKLGVRSRAELGARRAELLQT